MTKRELENRRSEIVPDMGSFNTKETDNTAYFMLTAKDAFHNLFRNSRWFWNRLDNNRENSEKAIGKHSATVWNQM